MDQSSVPKRLLHPNNETSREKDTTVVQRVSAAQVAVALSSNVAEDIMSWISTERGWSSVRVQKSPTHTYLDQNQTTT